MKKFEAQFLGLWLLTVLFFAYQFVLRLSPGVLIDEIMLREHIGVATFGLITSFYYIGYAGMQIPVGILLDKYGVRYVVAISSLLCVLGNLPLLFSDHWGVSLAGRFLIGMGSTAGVLGSIHAVRMHFPHRHLSKMIGLTVTLGLMGAIYGKSINRYLFTHMGLEKATIYLVIPGIIIALAMLFFFKEVDKKQFSVNQYHSSWAALKTIFKNGKIIWLSIAGGLMVGPLESFADVFGEPYLVTVYNFTPSDAGYLTASAIYLGFCVGAPMLATIADKFKCHYIINITCGIIMTLAFHMLLENLVKGYSFTFIWAVVIGLASSYQVILLSTVADLVPANLSSTAIAVVNMFNMSAGMAFNAAIGGLLEYYWTGEMLNGKRVYSDVAYADALYILPVTLMFGTIILFVLRSGNSQEVVNDSR